jgi:hypothetical protein
MKTLVVGDFSFSNTVLNTDNHLLLEFDETKEDISDAGERLMKEHNFTTYQDLEIFTPAQQKEIGELWKH